MSAVLAAAVLISSLFFIWFVKNAFVRRKLPPGPPPLPLLGNILQIKKTNIVLFLKEMRRRYGNIFTFYLGTHSVVVVSGYQELKDAFYRYGDAFSGRGETSCFSYFYGEFGFAFTTDMKMWRELRRFSLGVLREFGIGKKSIESVVQEEAENLIKEFGKYKDSGIDPYMTMAKASGNVISSISFGHRYEYDDEELNQLIYWMHDTFYLLGTTSGQLSDMFPGFMKHLPGTHQKMFKHMENLTSFVSDKVEEHKKTLDSSCPRDYIDAFLLKMEREKQDPNTDYNLKNLVFSTLQIIFAGTETTSVILTFMLLLLLKYPDIQGTAPAKIHHGYQN